MTELVEVGIDSGSSRRRRWTELAASRTNAPGSRAGPARGVAKIRRVSAAKLLLAAVAASNKAGRRRSRAVGNGLAFAVGHRCGSRAGLMRGLTKRRVLGKGRPVKSGKSVAVGGALIIVPLA